MKTLKFLFMVIATATLISCGGGVSKQAANAEGFGEIEEELKNKFGDDAYYTDLNISHDKSIGNMISLTVTENPASLKMGEYVYSNHTSWKQNSEVTIEIPEGSQAKDFMFQLDDKISLKKLGELVEVSGKKLTAEKDIKNPHLKMAFVKFPKNGDMSKAQYNIDLTPENGGTTFSFQYRLNGELIEMDY